MWLLERVKLWSSSLDESKEYLDHFSTILDHIVKVITTVGLLVALEVVRQKNDALVVDIMFAALAFAFFIYLLRVFEHVLVFYVDKYEWFRTDGARFRIVGGLTVLSVNVCLSLYGYDLIKALARINFLQGVD